MFGESWKRPSLVMAAWAVLLLAVFAARGDLRIERAGIAQPQQAPSAPVVVKAERPAPGPAAPAARRGKVFDAAGFLVVGAEVSIAGRAVSRTDADGQFVVALRDGELATVCVRAKDHRPHWLRAFAGSDDVLAVQLVPEAPWDEAPPPPVEPPLFGEGLVRSSGGEPVVGAHVTAAGSGSWSRTDDIGRYRLPLWSGEVTLIVRGASGPSGLGDDKGVAARSEPIELSRGQGVVPLPELVVEPAGAIRGVVRDARGTPLAGVPVQLRGDGLVWVTETGPGGRFDIGGLQAGSYTVRPFGFRGSFGVPQPVVLDRRVVECDLHLRPAEERRLRVVDDRGAGVPHACVAAMLAGERTSVGSGDADGWVTVRLCAGATAVEMEFEVRSGPDLQPAAVQRFDPDAATLTVALN